MQAPFHQSQGTRRQRRSRVRRGRGWRPSVTLTCSLKLARQKLGLPPHRFETLFLWTISLALCWYFFSLQKGLANLKIRRSPCHDNVKCSPAKWLKCTLVLALVQWRAKVLVKKVAHLHVCTQPHPNHKLSVAVINLFWSDFLSTSSP